MTDEQTTAKYTKDEQAWAKCTKDEQTRAKFTLHEQIVQNKQEWEKYTND